MRAKKFCLSKMPNLRAEKHTNKVGFKRTYWLIREIGKGFSFSEGKTENNAWVNAKKELLEREFEKIELEISRDNPNQ